MSRPESPLRPTVRQIGDGIVVCAARPLDIAPSPARRRLLTPAELLRYESATPGRGESFFAGRILVREAVAALTGMARHRVVITAGCVRCGGQHGKPTAAVAGASTAPLAVDISHADGVTVAGASFATALGIDIEADRDEVPKGLSLLDPSVFTGPTAHVRDWTRVEAVLKADGRGLTVDPGSVRLDRSGDRLKAVIRDSEHRYTVIDPPIIQGYAVSIAFRGNPRASDR